MNDLVSVQQSSSSHISRMGAWDLTSKIGPYLDRLLDFPLLEFLSVNEYYDETDLLRGQALDLLSNTSIPDQEVPLALC